ncbi:MAG: calcium/sodium antiporter [Gammaproteobacteria bacterium]|nr:MAG: calcium/sodium antiporter [Gammaproteobacteria bacterium]
MWLDILYVIGGLVVLLWSADKFIDGAAGTAIYVGLSPLMVGMLIVGFGTSAPEMIVSAFAAADGSPGIALGNAYGSNIANIGLVLGATALLYPLVAGSRIVRREIPLLVLVLLGCLGFLSDGEIGRVESILMLLSIAVIVVFNTFYSNENDSLTNELEESQPPVDSLSTSLFWLITGLVLLLVSSKCLVKGAVGIAEDFGVSDLVIGLTVIAVGTSLPELASSLAAAKKGESDIVLGNIIGSCLFNALAVVGIAGVIQPMPVESLFLWRDFSTGLVLTLILWVFAFGIRQKKTISRKEGGLFLASYVAYTGYLLWTLQ